MLSPPDPVTSAKAPLTNKAAFTGSGGAWGPGWGRGRAGSTSRGVVPFLQPSDPMASKVTSSLHKKAGGPPRGLRPSPRVLSCRRILFWPGAPHSRAFLGVGLTRFPSCVSVGDKWVPPPLAARSGPRGSQSVSCGGPQAERTVTEACVPGDSLGKRPERHGCPLRKEECFKAFKE